MTGFVVGRLHLPWTEMTASRFNPGQNGMMSKMRASTRFKALFVAMILGNSADAEEYLGRIGSNPFCGDCTANEFAPINNPFNPNSPRNEFGRYGNPFSPYSASNPFAVRTPKIYGDAPDSETGEEE